MVQGNARTSHRRGTAASRTSGPSLSTTAARFFKEMAEVPFTDWPLEGPRTVLLLAKRMDRHGRSPSAFLERWCRAKLIEDLVRVQHELRMIVDCIELLGTHGQVNLANLVGVEVLVRRLQTVFHVCEIEPTAPEL